MPPATVPSHLCSHRLRLPAAVCIVLVLVLGASSRAPAAPMVVWTPPTLSVTVVAGTPRTVPVSFSASEDLADVRVERDVVREGVYSS